MRYIVIADSDIGNIRKINQDSLLVKHIIYEDIEVLMAIICDGMGGLSKGELASATIIKEFNTWFESNVLFEIKNLDFNVIAHKWILILKNLNLKLQNYSNITGKKLGSTFTGILFVDEKFVIVHVGDTRIYHIDSSIEQLTKDHTIVAKELENGILTYDQAQMDRRQNILFQCIGASKTINPQIYYGRSQKGIYLLCSDGLRHKMEKNEILKYFRFKNLISKTEMEQISKQVIKIVKSRGEKDNISIILIKFNDVK